MLNVEVKEKLGDFRLSGLIEGLGGYLCMPGESVTKGFRISIKKDRVPVKDKRVWVGGA